MLSRTELEPISTAAKTGIRYQASRAWSWMEEADRGCFLSTGVSDENKLATAEFAAEYLAAKSERISTKADVQGAPAWSPDGRTLAYTTLPQSHASRADSISDVQIGNNHLMLYAVPFAQQNGAGSRERCRYGFGRIRPVLTKHTCKEAVEFLCERSREPAMTPFLPSIGNPERENVAPAGAERRADPDLAQPLRDGI